MRTAGATPSKTTIWRRKRAAAAAAVIVRHEGRDAYIDRLTRELGLGSRDWPKAKGEHRRLVMGDGATPAGDRAGVISADAAPGTASKAESYTCDSDNEVMPIPHDAVCRAWDGLPCDCCRLDVEQA